MISAVITSVTAAVTQFITVLTTGFSNLAELFFEETESGGYDVTFLGALLILSVGAGLVWLVYRIIKGAIRGVAK